MCLQWTVDNCVQIWSEWVQGTFKTAENVNEDKNRGSFRPTRWGRRRSGGGATPQVRRRGCWWQVTVTKQSGNGQDDDQFHFEHNSMDLEIILSFFHQSYVYIKILTKLYRCGCKPIMWTYCMFHLRSPNCWWSPWSHDSESFQCHIVRLRSIVSHNKHSLLWRRSLFPMQRLSTTYCECDMFHQLLTTGCLIFFKYWSLCFIFIRVCWFVSEPACLYIQHLIQIYGIN